MSASKDRQCLLLVLVLLVSQSAFLACSVGDKSAPQVGATPSPAATSSQETTSTSVAKSTAAPSPTPPCPQGCDTFSLDQAKLSISKDKDLGESYAKIAKDTLANKPELKTIQNAYVELTATYNGWLRVVKIAVATNDKKFEKSAAHKEAARNAARKTEDFVNLVKSKTGATGEQKIGFAVLFSALVDAGVKIWKAHKELQIEQRKAIAEYIEETLKWKTWDEIGTSTTAPSPSPAASPTVSPKPSSSPSSTAKPQTDR